MITGDVFQYGQSMSLSSGFEFMGFLRPMELDRSESIRFREAAGIAGEKYLLITPPDLFDRSDEGTGIFYSGTEYELLRVEKKLIGGQVTHTECLLRQLGRAHNA